MKPRVAEHRVFRSSLFPTEKSSNRGEALHGTDAGGDGVGAGAFLGDDSTQKNRYGCDMSIIDVNADPGEHF
jgi:hypothetical protein